MAKRRTDAETGAEIRRIRGGLSQKAFADRLGLRAPGGQTQVSGWENGSPASDETLQKIATEFGEPLAVFYEEEAAIDRPLATHEVARLRDQVTEIRTRADEVLAALEDALARVAPTLALREAKEQEGGAGRKALAD